MSLNSNTRILIYILFWFIIVNIPDYSLGQNYQQTYQLALQKEVGSGDLEEAIKLYKQIVEDQLATRNLRANAQLHIGICYDKLGMKKARTAYQTVIDDFSDQKEIATEARKLMGRFIVESPYIDPEAHRAYLLADHFVKLGDPYKAVGYYNMAINIDTTYAAAYSGLAETYAYSGRLGTPSVRMEKAKGLAIRALSLEENLADAHAVLAIINLFYYWDWEKAEIEFKKALEIKPLDTEIIESYSILLETLGRFDEALVELEKIMLINPAHPWLNDCLGDLYYYMRDYEKALELYYDTLELNPLSRVTNVKISNIYHLQGRELDEIEALNKYFRAIDRAAFADTFITTYRTDGYQAAINKWIEDWEPRTGGKGAQGPSLARSCVRIDKYDEAIHWLQVGYETRDRDMIQIGILPEFDPLRSDPRFIELLDKVGLRW